MASSEPRAEGPPRTYLLFFRYVTSGPYTEGESNRRARASKIVEDMGGSCEILRLPSVWNGFNMVSIVRGLSAAAVTELARTINSWGAVEATVVETSEIARGLRR
jgi:uncharacterized protein with GYD domain